MTEFERVKNDINSIELGHDMKVEHYDRVSGDIIYMMRVTGFIHLRQGLNIIGRHVPSWFTFEHLEFLMNVSLDNKSETTSDGYTHLDLARLLYEYGIKDRKAERQNMTFTRPGKYTYTYEKTTI